MLVVLDELEWQLLAQLIRPFADQGSLGELVDLAEQRYRSIHDLKVSLELPGPINFDDLLFAFSRERVNQLDDAKSGNLCTKAEHIG